MRYFYGPEKVPAHRLHGGVEEGERITYFPDKVRPKDIPHCLQAHPAVQEDGSGEGLQNISQNLRGVPVFNFLPPLLLLLLFPLPLPLNFEVDSLPGTQVLFRELRQLVTTRGGYS